MPHTILNIRHTILNIRHTILNIPHTIINIPVSPSPLTPLGRPARHLPCTKPAVTIVKLIYDDEEVRRREIEEEAFMEIFEEVDLEVHYFELLCIALL